jgi:hypothetical protein
VVSTQVIASLFGFDEILLSDAIKNTAIEGQAASTSVVWGDDVYVFYRPPSPGMMVPAMGYRFDWSPFSGSPNGWMVNRWREEGIHSDMVEVMKYYDQRIILATAGYRLKERLT